MASASEQSLLPILRQAFPNLKSYDVEHTISQANAEGQRLTILMHQDDDPHHDIQVFVKQVVAADYLALKKDWADLCRTLLYIRNEVRFYQETLPRLQAKGFSAAPKVYIAQHNLYKDWLPETEPSTTTPKEPAIYPQLLEQQQACEHGGEGEMDAAHRLETGAGILVMECVSEQRYRQDSPVSMEQAKLCLAAAADLHAAAWQDETLLRHVEERLSLASFHLSVRNPKELAGVEAAWEQFATAFREPLQQAGLLDRTATSLGRRIRACAQHISNQVSASPTDSYCTIVHGDYKAMNVFLPRNDVEDSNKTPALLVDYASTGIGLGMGDVAMHIHHAVRPQDLANGGEESLVNFYLGELNQRLEAQGKSRYEKDVAWRHYRYSVVDYGRFVMGRFWKVATPEAFEKKKNSKNTTLVNRDVAAAMAYVDRIERYLTEIESELNHGA
eukprot:scaffold982_cov169-Amphora_coffeaeformis.AAC.15